MKLNSLIAFAGGVLVGGVAALLLSPKSGAELRHQMGRKLEEAKKQMDEAVKKCKMAHSESNEQIPPYE